MVYNTYLDSKPRVEHRSAKTGGSDSWRTPDDVLDLVRSMGSVVTDPCTAWDNPVGADVYYTISENGLRRPWYGFTYVNPPYSNTKAWLAKAAYEVSRDRGVEVLSLIPARTGALWFQPNYNYPICLWRGRLKFKGATHCAPFDSAVVYIGHRQKLFIETFRPRGVVVTPNLNGVPATCQLSPPKRNLMMKSLPD